MAVYQFNPLRFQRVAGSTTADNFSFTNDASLLLPQNVLANQHIVVTARNERFVGEFGEVSWASAFVTIVGAQNEGTNTVTVRLTAPVIDPANPARTLSGEQNFDLDRGEVLQLMAAPQAGDLTGTLVNSSGPVAVFAGHDCARIPTGNPACDHLEEQLFPTTTWGKTYAVTPFRDRPTNVAHVVRIVAQRDGVTLSFDGIAAPAACNRMLNQGQFCEFETQTPFQVTGSQPIMVAQFMRSLGSDPQCQCQTDLSGRTTCPRLAKCVADPAMVLEVPTDQYRNSYNFLIPDSYEQNYINVIAPRGAMVTLDGNMLMGTPANVGSNLVVYYLNVPAGQHELKTMSNVERVGLKVYGVASFTSYAFPGGLDLAPISPPG
ncbi:MAG: IgGFc-binding protein [Polyangiales bacterium]